MGSFFISSATSLRSGRVRRSQRTYLVRFIPVRRLWRKQHGDEHLGEQEAERRSNFVHLKKSSFQIIPTNVQHCTWLGFFLPPAVRDFRQEKSPGRVGRCRIEPTRKQAHIQKISKRDTKRARRDMEFAPQHSGRKNHMKGQAIVIFRAFRNQSICLWKRIKGYAIMSIKNRARCSEKKK